MRDSTKKEYESVNNYIKSISTETGINFWDLIKYLKRYPHQRLEWYCRCNRQ